MVYTKSPLRDFPCPLSNGYDALGRRVITVSGGVTNFHVYDGLNVLADTDATGGVLRVYGHGIGIDHLLTMTVYTSGTVKTYYYLTDQLGSVHALVDEVGNVVESYRFDAWGKVVGIYDGNGNHLSESAYGNRFLWQGREYSYRTGFYYFRARWYDPVMGRWLSNDPIGISGGLNQHVFCANNPVNFRDPLGLAVFLSGGNLGGGDGFSMDVEQGVLYNSGVNSITAGPSSVPANRSYGVFDFTVDSVMAASMFTPVGAGRGTAASARFIYDPRAYSTVRNAYWGARGGAGSMTLHHWFFPQRWTWIPQGIRNAGFNLLVVPRSFNSWMGYSNAGRWVETAIRLGIPSSIVGAIFGGSQLGEEVQGDTGDDCK